MWQQIPTELRMNNAMQLVRFWIVLHLLITAVMGFYPLVWSLLTYSIAALGDSAGVRIRMGSRPPVKEEQEKVSRTLKEIQKKQPRIKAPYRWEVLDNPFPNSFTIGGVSFLSSGLIESDYLEPAMAHELGHVNQKDGRLLLSLRRLIIPLAYFYGIDTAPLPAGPVSGGQMATTVSMGDDAALFYRMQAVQTQFEIAKEYGGMSLFRLGEQWAAFWQNQDFKADDFAAELGYRDQLIAFLEEYKPLDNAVPFLMRMRPYTALRIDNLRHGKKWRIDGS